ncbi:MAG: hypothetical protein J6Q25_07720 [Bacteroidales bacterium]|nr:hypothetical protein [Bacteroidales bacterium]
MKKSLSLFLLLFCAYGAYAQMINDSIVQVCAYWGQGDSAVYQCYTYNESLDETGKVKVKKNLSEKRIFQVIDMTDSTYVLKVTYDDVVDSTGLFNAATSTAIQRIAESMSIELLTDEWGMPLAYNNLEEIVKANKKLIPKVIESVLDSLDAKERRAIKKWVKSIAEQMLTSTEAIMQACNEDVMPLLELHGNAFVLRKPEELEVTMPNLLGVEFPCTKVYYVDTVMYEGDAFVLLKETIDADTKALTPLLKQVVMRMMQPQLSDASSLVSFMQSFEETIQSHKMQAFLKMECVTLVHLSSGWTYSWDYNKTFHMKIGDSMVQDREQKTIRLIELN